MNTILANLKSQLYYAETKGETKNAIKTCAGDVVRWLIRETIKNILEQIMHHPRWRVDGKFPVKGNDFTVGFKVGDIVKTKPSGDLRVTRVTKDVLTVEDNRGKTAEISGLVYNECGEAEITWFKGLVSWEIWDSHLGVEKPLSRAEIRKIVAQSQGVPVKDIVAYKDMKLGDGKPLDDTCFCNNDWNGHDLRGEFCGLKATKETTYSAGEALREQADAISGLYDDVREPECVCSMWRGRDHTTDCKWKRWKDKQKK